MFKSSAKEDAKTCRGHVVARIGLSPFSVYPNIETHHHHFEVTLVVYSSPSRQQRIPNLFSPLQILQPLHRKSMKDT